MKRKDYIFNMVGLIINRVKFHAPICESGVDLDRVIAEGVDPTLPVFIFDKPLTRLMAKCFLEAKKAIAFNLVLSHPQKHADKLGAIISQDEEVKKLDVNYKSGLKFDLQESENFIKINGLQPTRILNDFYLESYGVADEISYFTREFMLAGHNTIVELLNTSMQEKKVQFELNFVLPKGYYSFQKQGSNVQITNLFTFERQHFNFSSFNTKFSFSCVDGVENSSFARIYLSAQITLKPKQKKTLFFNLGKQKFVLRNREEIAFFSKLAKKKNEEIFNVKVVSENKKKEGLINHILPEKIYTAWLSGKEDKQSEIRYGKLKEGYVVSGREGFILQDLTDLREIKLFSGEEYKTIAVDRAHSLGTSGYLQIGSTKFFGKNTLSHKDLARKNTQILVG